MHCFDEPENQENLERARGWLINANVAGLGPAASPVAGLYARAMSKASAAARTTVGLRGAILKDHDDAETRRYLAQMLVNGKGTEKDVARAEALLRTDAEKGDAESQSVLGAWLLDLDETDARRSEGREWLKKSAAGGTTGAVRYAARSGTRRGGVVDHAKAREIWQAGRLRTTPRSRATCSPGPSARRATWRCSTRRPGSPLPRRVRAAENAPIQSWTRTQPASPPASDHAAAATMQQRVVTAMEALPSASKEGIERMRKRLALYQRGEQAVEDE